MRGEDIKKIFSDYKYFNNDEELKNTMIENL
jgi:hypothetical protein